MIKEKQQKLLRMKLYRGEKERLCCGKIVVESFTGQMQFPKNAFGYYEESPTKWVGFITNYKGEALFQIIAESEEKVIDRLIEVIKDYNYLFLLDSIENGLDESNQLISKCFPDFNSSSAGYHNDFLQEIGAHPPLMLELLYYNWFHDFVPDEYACIYDGHTARIFVEDWDFSISEAFHQMILLRKGSI